MIPEEKLTLARWIDLGAPIDLGTPWGFLEDDLRPTLVLRPSVAQARAAGGLDTLEISAFDTESGVVPGSLTVTCNLRLGAFAPGPTWPRSGRSIPRAPCYAWFCRGGCGSTSGRCSR